MSRKARGQRRGMKKKVGLTDNFYNFYRREEKKKSQKKRAWNFGEEAGALAGFFGWVGWPENVLMSAPQRRVPRWVSSQSAGTGRSSQKSQSL